MFTRRDTQRAPSRGGRNLGVRSAEPQRQPVDILGKQMALAKVARVSGDWESYAQARDRAIHLVLSHRIEDEVSRFRQVVMACTGTQDWGDDARELMHKRLIDAFQQGIDRGETAHDLVVRMQRIPRTAAAAAMVGDLRRGDGEACINFLLTEDGHVVADVRERFGEDPAQIAKRFTDRDWAEYAMAMLRIQPGEPRDEVADAGRVALRRALSEIAKR